MEAHVGGLLSGLMVYWKEVPDAALYRIRLYVGEFNPIDPKSGVQYFEIASVEEPRSIKYHTFQGLAVLDNRFIPNSPRLGFNGATRHYSIVVEAEDRNGKIIDQTQHIGGQLDQVVGDISIRHY